MVIHDNEEDYLVKSIIHLKNNNRKCKLILSHPGTFTVPEDYDIKIINDEFIELKKGRHIKGVFRLNNIMGVVPE